MNTFSLRICLLFVVTASSAFSQLATPDREFQFASKLLEDGLHLLAAKQFQEFAERYPGHAKADHALLLGGDSFMSISKNERAFSLLKALELNYPQSRFLAEARYKLAQTQSAAESYAPAAELFRRVHYFHPESELAPRALLQAVRSLELAGEFDAALKTALTLIADYPTSEIRLFAHLRVIEVHAAQGQLAAAIAHSDDVLRIYGPDFKDAGFYHLRARIFEKTGQTSSAEAIYAQIRESYPGTGDAYQASFHLGRHRLDAGDFQNALAYFAEPAPDGLDSQLGAAANFKRGEVLSTLGRTAEALAAFEAAQELDNGKLRRKILLKSAGAQFALGDFGSAEANLKEILATDTSATTPVLGEAEFAETSDLLVEVLVQSGRGRDALEVLSKRRTRFPNSPDAPRAAMKRGEIHENSLNNCTAALRIYQEVIEEYAIHPLVDDAQFAIARCYEKLASYKIAQAEYSAYLTRFPGGDHYQDALTRKEMLSRTMVTDQGALVREISNLYARSTQQQNMGTVRLNLSRVYFKNRSFLEAIALLKDVLREESDPELRPEIFFLLGKSYFALRTKHAILANPLQSRAFADSAVISLSYVADQKPAFAEGEEVDYLLVTIAAESATPDSSKKLLAAAAARWLEAYPDGKFLDRVLVRAGDGHFQKGEISDSTGNRMALKYYSDLIKLRPESEFYDRSFYRSLLCARTFVPDSLIAVRCSQFVQTHPSSQYLPKVLLLQARTERQLGLVSEAATTLRRIQSQFFYAPEASAASSELGDLEFERQNYKSALDLYQSVRGSNAAALAAHADLQTAITLERLQVSEKAMAAYVGFIQRHPRHRAVPNAMLRVARLAAAGGNNTFAEEYYRNILTLNIPEEGKYDANRALADLMFAQRDFDEALGYYGAAKAGASNSALARYPQERIIRCNYKLRRTTAADQLANAFEKSFEDTQREKSQFQLDKADGYKAAKSFDLARKWYSQARKSGKEFDVGARAEFGLGAVELITNHTEEALKILTELPSKYPDSEVVPLTYFNLGDFYYKSQQLENAIHAFEKAIEHPEGKEVRPKSKLYLIKCYKDMRYWDRAIALTREYLSSYPDAEDSFARKVDLGQLLMSLKEYDRAITHLKGLLPYADAESEASIQFYIAQSYKEMGNFRQATAEYLKVKYLTRPTKLPWHVTALFETGKCLVRLNDLEQARMVFRKIVLEQGIESNFGRFAQKQIEELDLRLTAEPAP